MFDKPKTSLSKDQIRFVIEIMLASAMDSIADALEERVNDDQLIAAWRSNIDILNDEEAAMVRNITWNLSILYAQIVDDGLGNGDVLYILSKWGVDIEEIILKWGKDVMENVQAYRRLDKSIWHNKGVNKIYNVVPKRFAEFIHKERTRENRRLAKRLGLKDLVTSN